MTASTRWQYRTVQITPGRPGWGLVDSIFAGPSMLLFFERPRSPEIR